MGLARWRPDLDVHANFLPLVRARVCAVLALAATDPTTGNARYPGVGLYRLPIELLVSVCEIAAAGRNYDSRWQRTCVGSRNRRDFSRVSVAVDHTDRILIGDCQGLFAWSRGDAKAQRLARACVDGLACFASGDVVFCVMENASIVVVSSNGTIVSQFGTRGRKPGEIVCPVGLAVDRRQNIVVADAGNCRVQTFTRAGELLHYFDLPRTGYVTSQQWPSGVAVTHAGDIVVAEAAADDSESPSKVRVFRPTASGAALVRVIGSDNPRGFKFLANPDAVAVDAEGNIVVADTNRERVVVFRPDGTPLWSRKGFELPGGVAVLSSGGIVVVERASNKVWVT